MTKQNDLSNKKTNIKDQELFKDMLKRSYQKIKPDPSSGDNSHVVVGEVVDTHHPELRGRVFVQWFEENGENHQKWLSVVNGLYIQKGDRVLVIQPENWNEKIITNVLEGALGSDSVVEEQSEKARILELEQNETIQLQNAEGKPLIDIRSSTQGPVVRILNNNLQIEASGRLKFKAETVEIEGGRGGVDIRTEADTVVRSRHIRLN